MGRLAEDMQAIADLRLFQLAEIGVELRQIALGLAGKPCIHGKAGHIRERQDLAAQVVDAAGIDAGGLVIFIDQRLEIAQRAIAFGAGERRGQVIDDDNLRAALGLRALAGIVDDEGIEMRQGAEDCLGPAGLGQCHRLAR